MTHGFFLHANKIILGILTILEFYMGMIGEINGL